MKDKETGLLLTKKNDEALENARNELGDENKNTNVRKKSPLKGLDTLIHSASRNHDKIMNPINKILVQNKVEKENQSLENIENIQKQIKFIETVSIMSPEKKDKLLTKMNKKMIEYYEKL